MDRLDSLDVCKNILMDGLVYRSIDRSRGKQANMYCSEHCDVHYLGSSTYVGKYPDGSIDSEMSRRMD